MAAIRLVRAAEHTDEDIAEHALSQARAEGTTGWQLAAIRTLVDTETAMMLSDEAGDPIYEGRHRTTAMLDAGVRRTLVARCELLDPGHRPAVAHGPGLIASSRPSWLARSHRRQLTARGCRVDTHASATTPALLGGTPRAD